ncbi:MAG: CARDB domain-containing protein, partial [Myxococcota bacterium]
VDLTLTVPPSSSVDVFYISVVVDSAREVAEAVESNNVAFSAPFATGPDLIGTLEGPAEAGPGEVVPVQLHLRSAGTPVAREVTVAFYLSTTPTRSPSSVLLGMRSLTLPNGFTLRQTVALSIPFSAAVSPPAFFVVAEIDAEDAIEETDESNNTVSTASFQIRGPDLRVAQLNGRATGFRGEAYPVDLIVQNTGSATARDFEVCIVLSDDLDVSLTTDRVIARAAALVVAPQSQATLRIEPVIPSDLALGAWYLAAVVDCADAVMERDERDNVIRRPDPIAVRDAAPDFTPVSITTASVAAAGQTIPLAVTVANLGYVPGTTNVRVVLSANPGVTAQDTVVFETLAPLTLVPPEEGTVAGWGEISSTFPSGRYFVGAIVDPSNAIDEVFETNNTLVEGPIDIRGSGLAIVTPAPPNALIDAPYARQFDAVGGTGTEVWSLEWISSSPDGLRFDADRALLFGVPTAVGAFEFTVTVTSGRLRTSRDYRLIVTASTIALTVVSARVPPAFAGEAYGTQLVAVGGQPPYEWRLTSDAPLGLGLSAQGQLGGEPQIREPSMFAVEVTDAAGAVAAATIVIDVLDPAARLTITTADLPAGLAGTAYLAEIRTDGGTLPYRWTREGALPPGLIIRADETLQITGTPTVAGQYPLVVAVEDVGVVLDRKAYLVEVIEAGALVILTGQTDQPLPRARLGEPYRTVDGQPVVLRASPAGDLDWSIVGGALPAGLQLTSNGTVEGTPTESGAFGFLVLVTDSSNDVHRAPL